MLYPLLTRVMFSAVLFFLGLSITKTSVAQPRKSDVATFYTFTIRKADPQPQLTLINKQQLRGEYKIPDLATPLVYESGLLVIKVSDKSGNIVYETSVNNPLEQHIEHADERGRLTRAHVKNEEGTIDLRVPLNTTNHSLNVYSVDTNNRLILLSTF